MKWWHAVGIVALLAIGSRMAFLNSTRGLRNRNPGNLREGAEDQTLWKGERATDDDPDFEEFDSFDYGIRAIGRVLDSYERRDLRTVRAIITTFAPPVENDTGAYIQSVSGRVGVDPDKILGPEHRTDLVAAIIHHENGYNPFSKSFIADSLAIA